MLTVPDYFSCVSHSWTLVLRGHVYFLRAEVRFSSDPLFLKTEVILTLFPVVEDLLQVPAGPTHLNVCKLYKQTLNCYCSTAACPFPSQTVPLRPEVVELVFTVKTSAKKSLSTLQQKWETTVGLAKYTKWKEEHGFVALKNLQPVSSFYHIGSDFALVQIDGKFLNTTLEKFGLVYFTNAFTLKMYCSIHSLYVSSWNTQLWMTAQERLMSYLWRLLKELLLFPVLLDTFTPFRFLL